MIQMVMVHRLNQHFSTQQKSVDEYNSLQSWRNAASHRYTFYQSLNKTRSFFDKELKRIKDAEANGHNPVTLSTPPPSLRRRNPNRAMVAETIPFEPQFVLPKTGSTPTKMAPKKLE